MERAEKKELVATLNQVFSKEAVEEEAWKKTLELSRLPPLAFAESKSMRTASRGK